ncbi:hypothetical protein OUZ56_026145 [Daphnia magna]|uniref:Uncharacterized protein n=1 Tax=Daphnia magna TaxID=35525 RepID=A0ABQ9ZKZ3_9CRUS|nr:hypothetical protein OUZ56_026145 [Daphnia magna]
MYSARSIVAKDSQLVTGHIQEVELTSFALGRSFIAPALQCLVGVVASAHWLGARRGMYVTSCIPPGCKKMEITLKHFFQLDIDHRDGSQRRFVMVRAMAAYRFF